MNDRAPRLAGRSGVGSRRLMLSLPFRIALLWSFLYFRIWALAGLRGQPAFAEKWTLGLCYDLGAWALACLLLSFVGARASRPGRWLRGGAVLLVFLNWGNFELFRHVGQPFLPQILGVLSPADAFDAFGAQMVWGLLHPGHFIGAFVLPSGVLLSLRFRAERTPQPLRRTLAFVTLLALIIPWGIEQGFPAASSHPRTLAWNFYGHGAFHWPAHLWHGDEARAAGELTTALTKAEFNSLRQVLDGYLTEECSERPDARYPLYRRPRPCSAPQEESPSIHPSSDRGAAPPGMLKNVILVHLESFRAASFDGLGDVWQGITPRLGQLMQQSAYFTRAFTNSVPTDRSLTSMLCSVPVPDVSLARIHRPRPRVTCLPELLAEAGYRNVRMSGIPSGFQKLGEFFAENGVAETYGSVELQEAFPHPELEGLGERGYDRGKLYDERLFYAARRWIDRHRTKRPGQPFFMLLETMTNHLPWELPDTRHLPLARYQGLRLGEEVTGTEETTRMHRTMRLTDDYVSDFVEWIASREEGRLERETIIVFYSDHPPWFPEPDFTRYPLVVKESWIPLFIVGVSPARRYDHPVSLLGVAPTVLELTGVRGAHSFVGKSLLDVDAERWFSFSQPGGRRAYFAAGELWVLEDGSRVRLGRDMTFEALPSTVLVDGASGPVGRLAESEVSWSLLERYVHRGLLVGRALRP